jgi:hypothetical protein
MFGLFVVQYDSIDTFLYRSQSDSLIRHRKALSSSATVSPINDSGKRATGRNRESYEGPSRRRPKPKARDDSDDEDAPPPPAAAVRGTIATAASAKHAAAMIQTRTSRAVPSSNPEPEIIQMMNPGGSRGRRARAKPGAVTTQTMTNHATTQNPVRIPTMTDPAIIPEPGTVQTKKSCATTQKSATIQTRNPPTKSNRRERAGKGIILTMKKQGEGASRTAVKKEKKSASTRTRTTGPRRNVQARREGNRPLTSGMTTTMTRRGGR